MHICTFSEVLPLVHPCRVPHSQGSGGPLRVAMRLTSQRDSETLPVVAATLWSSQDSTGGTGPAQAMHTDEHTEQMGHSAGCSRAQAVHGEPARDSPVWTLEGTASLPQPLGLETEKGAGRRLAHQMGLLIRMGAWYFLCK